MDTDEPGTGVSRFAKLAKAPDGRVAIVWEDDRAGLESVYLRVRSAGQKPQWGPEVLVAPATAKLAARVPEAAWGSAGLHVSWQVWDHWRAPGGIEKQVDSRVRLRVRILDDLRTGRDHRTGGMGCASQVPCCFLARGTLAR